MMRTAPCGVGRDECLGYVPAVAAIANEAPRWRLNIAIAALGMKTSFQKFAAVGWKPVAPMMVETLWPALLALAIIRRG